METAKYFSNKLHNPLFTRRLLARGLLKYLITNNAAGRGRKRGNMSKWFYEKQTQATNDIDEIFLSTKEIFINRLNQYSLDTTKPLLIIEKLK